MPVASAPTAPTGGDSGGAAALLAFPDDVLSLISALLRPRDLCSLSLTSRSLRSALSASDKPWWLPQCRRLLPSHLLPSYRSALPSYRALSRFLHSAAPLLGLWVHQNPELGNLVSVSFTPHRPSLLALRILPQESGTPLLFSPVFEILPDPLLGSPSLFFLHGRDPSHSDALHPGTLLSPVRLDANLLLLEVDVDVSNPQLESISSKTLDTSQFGQLPFRDRRRLLDLVAGRVRLKLPPHLASAPLLGDCGDPLLDERSSALVQLHKINGGCVDRRTVETQSGWARERSGASKSSTGLFCMSGSFKDRLKQMMGRSGSTKVASLGSRNGSDSKHVQLSEFLGTGGTIGLVLRAAHSKLSTYRAWPNMHDSRFALYKLPLQSPGLGQEYAGLWGGTFGWPPGQPTEHRLGKALFFLSLSYEEIAGCPHLIGTKILEGTHYVLHPNGSAMFTVKVDEDASEPFPWEFDGDSLPIEVKHSYDGEGIASGYGFRYPGSKPGTLFEIQNELLAFVWKESKAVLTLQRLDLEELLRKGERMPTLPPIANFVYLTKSYSNVFVGFPGNTNCSSSPRFE